MKKFILLSLLILLGSAFYFASSSGLINSYPLKSKVFGPKTYKSIERDKRIEISHNPVVLSKHCDKKETVRFKIHGPDISRLSSRPHENIYIAKLYIDEKLYSEKHIDDNFKYTCDDGKTRTRSYKWEAFEVPNYQEILKDETSVTLKLFDLKDVFLKEFSGAIKYLEDGEKVEVAYKKTGYEFICGRPQEFNSVTPSIILKQPGKYYTDYFHRFSIKKEENHFKIISTFTGNNVYKEGSSVRVLKTPNLPSFVETVPLAFDIQEFEFNRPSSFGYYLFDNEDVGKKVGFTIDKDVVGYLRDVSFDSCERIVENEKQVSYPAGGNLCLLD